MVEFGRPAELLSNENGVFRSMVMRHGKTAFENMMQLAMGRRLTEDLAQ